MTHATSDYLNRRPRSLIEAVRDISAQRDLPIWVWDQLLCPRRDNVVDKLPVALKDAGDKRPVGGVQAEAPAVANVGRIISLADHRLRTNTTAVGAWQGPGSAA